MALLMACYLTAPSYYLNQCWQSLGTHGIHLWAIWQEMLKISLLDVSLKIINFILQLHHPGENELRCMIHSYTKSTQSFDDLNSFIKDIANHETTLAYVMFWIHEWSEICHLFKMKTKQKYGSMQYDLIYHYLFHLVFDYFARINTCWYHISLSLVCFQHT